MLKNENVLCSVHRYQSREPDIARAEILFKKVPFVGRNQSRIPGGGRQVKHILPGYPGEKMMANNDNALPLDYFSTGLNVSSITITFFLSPFFC